MYTTAFLDLPPLQSVGGTVRLPGSKSISNRVLLLAGLSEGTTHVHDLLASDDTRVMLEALRALGCDVQMEGDTLHLGGLGRRAPLAQADLFLGNAGTAMRPLTAALALLSCLHGGTYTLSGIARMHERPIGDLIDALRPLGCDIACLAQEGYPPLRLGPGTLKLDRPIEVRGDVSSQFLTALLMALPLVCKEQSVRIEVIGELISKPYIDITLNLLARFGIQVERDAHRSFVIPKGSQYRSPGAIHVEADASSASYFIAAGALAATPEQALRIEGVGAQSIQGDIRFVEAAQAMGAQVRMGPNWLEVHRGPDINGHVLRGIELDCNHIPDAAMTLAVMALYAQGPTTLRNIASWRVKETDRIEAMSTELRKLGAQVDSGPDWLRVSPPAAGGWTAATIHTYDDHRMAMCFSLAAFNALAQGTTPRQAVTVRIEDPRCVGKTFPDYFEALFQVAQTDPEVIPVLTVDGPTASGKGTLASALAKRLGYRFLDSGSLYRIVALLAIEEGLDLDNDRALEQLARQMGESVSLRFEDEHIWVDGRDVSDALRREDVGQAASRLSVHGIVRQALRELQLNFRGLPGLVADGRDMGTVVFPDARLKVFLTADVRQRALRRHKQLMAKGISANLEQICADLQDRDVRDRSRVVAPLQPAKDAQLLDNSSLDIDASVDQVLAWWMKRAVS